MPGFAAKAKLEQYRQDIRSGKKKYKDFYIDFRDKLLQELDEAVSVENFASIGEPKTQGKQANLAHWTGLPWELRVKTYLTVYSVDYECRVANLSPREVNICRWACLLLHIGCAKKSKTSKIYIYSFLSALFIIQMLQQDSLEIKVS